VRRLTLEQEKAGSEHKLHALLLLAENTAKVAYNASGAPAPFDADSGDWIAQNAKAFLDAAPHSAQAESIVEALFRKF
jgi:hypothetical protein